MNTDILKDYADMNPEDVRELLVPIWPSCPGVDNIKTWSRNLIREAVGWAKGERIKPEYLRVWERK